MLALAARLDYRRLAVRAVTKLRSRLPTAVLEDEQHAAEEGGVGAPRHAAPAALAAAPTWREAIEEVLEGSPAAPHFLVAGSDGGSTVTDLTEMLLSHEATSLDVAASWPPPVYGSYF